MRWGVDPGRLVLVQAQSGAEVLRLVNDALRVRAPEVVVGDLWDDAALADLSVTRRFNLAAANARVLALLTTPDLSATSAALTRWQRRFRAQFRRPPPPRRAGPRPRTGPQPSWTHRPLDFGVEQS